MPLIKRLVKGSPLTFQEGDDNLQYLEDLALSAATTGSNSFSGSQVVTGSIKANYIDAPSRYELVTHTFEDGSIFLGENAISSRESYNPNYPGNISVLVTDYLSYVYVDIYNTDRTIKHEGLTFDTIDDLKMFANSSGINSGSITLYSYKNDTSNLVLGGYNYFITNTTFRGIDGKISSKTQLAGATNNKIDTTSIGYTALKTYLTGSFKDNLSSSISLPLLNEIILNNQIDYIVNSGSISFMNMDKYNKRKLSGFYISLVGNTSGRVVNSTGDGFFNGGNKSKLLSTTLLSYDLTERAIYHVHTSTPFWGGTNRTILNEAVNSNCINLYIVQDVDNNGRALYIEPISIDGISIPFSSKKWVSNEANCKYFIKRGNSLAYIDNTSVRRDARLNIESVNLLNVFINSSFLKLKNKKSRKQIDVIRLYSDRTCDVFEDNLRLEHSTYNGNINNSGLKAYYFKLNKR